jgi:hypothetical protein
MNHHPLERRLGEGLGKPEAAGEAKRWPSGKGRLVEDFIRCSALDTEGKTFIGERSKVR